MYLYPAFKNSLIAIEKPIFNSLNEKLFSDDFKDQILIQFRPPIFTLGGDKIISGPETIPYEQFLHETNTGGQFSNNATIQKLQFFWPLKGDKSLFTEMAKHSLLPIRPPFMAYADNEKFGFIYAGYDYDLTNENTVTRLREESAELLRIGLVNLDRINITINDFTVKTLEPKIVALIADERNKRNFTSKVKKAYE